MEERWSIKQILLDTLLLAAVGLPTTIIRRNKNIFKRGFFCEDETIMYPMTGPSTIENKYFHPLGCLSNVVLILLIEYLRQRKSAEKNYLWRFKLPKWCYTAYSVLLSFAFGILCTLLVMTVLKGSIGRLRPFFFVDCVPNVNCSLPENQHIYHTNYQCTNKKFKQNTRMSFPSGHASFAMYCALFLVIYIQKRVSWQLSQLLKGGIQVVLILLALCVGVSRICDYKHHLGDVIGGIFVGGGCAIIVSLNLYKNLAFVRTKAKALNSVESEPGIVLK